MNFHEALIRFWETNSSSILGFGLKLLITVLIIIGGKIVTTIFKHMSQKAVNGKLQADETLFSVLGKVVFIGVIIICLIMILDLYGVNTTGLITLLGAAGVAVGFALRDTLSNIASGIVILLLRPFKKGDFIECGSVMGAVREMGLFASILETPDGVFIAAPTSSLWGVPLKNYSRNSKRRLDIPVTISYSDSIDTAFSVLREITGAERRFHKDPAPQVMVQSLGETGIGITLRAWVDGSNYWPVYWEQMKNIKEKIQEAGLTIALPRREIHLVKTELMKSDLISSGQHIEKIS
jgi:small conductance mechanosensitive channel